MKPARVGAHGATRTPASVRAARGTNYATGLEATFTWLQAEHLKR